MTKVLYNCRPSLQAFLCVVHSSSDPLRSVLTMWQDLMLPSGNNDIIIPIDIVGDSRGEEVVHTSTLLWSSTLFGTQSLYITHRQSDRNFILFEQRSYLLFGPGPMRSAGMLAMTAARWFYDSSECLAFFILSSLLVGKELTKTLLKDSKEKLWKWNFFLCYGYSNSCWRITILQSDNQMVKCNLRVGYKQRLAVVKRRHDREHQFAEFQTKHRPKYQVDRAVITTTQRLTCADSCFSSFCFCVTWKFGIKAFRVQMANRFRSGCHPSLPRTLRRDSRLCLMIPLALLFKSR